MSDAGASGATRALAIRSQRVLSDSSPKPRSVRSALTKQWQPPEGLAPEDILAVIDAAPSERDRLLLRVLWAAKLFAPPRACQSLRSRRAGHACRWPISA